MANFKVGQRVKIIGHVLEPGNADFRGREGEVTGFETTNCRGLTVAVSGLCPSFSLMFAPAELAPLTDPGAEKFIASLDKLIREPQPQIRRETALHSQGNLQEKT